jgi:hypothetical protein
MPYVLYPHKQTLLDLQCFVQELQQEGEEEIIFLDVNQDDQQKYLPQEHNECFKTRSGFHADGSIDGSLRKQISNTHVRGSKHIYFALVTYGIRPCIKAIGLLDELILKSDHRAIFIDLYLLLLFGVAPERVERPQFRNLKLDDPRISDSYRKLLHKQFECHNIYELVKKIYERGKTDVWSIDDEHTSKTLNRDITAAMLRAAEKCSIQKQHDTPWAPSLSKATHAIWYWTTLISKNGILYAEDCVLEY